MVCQYEELVSRLDRAPRRGIEGHTHMSCFENMGRTLGSASIRVMLILSASSGYHCERPVRVSMQGPRHGRAPDVRFQDPPSGSRATLRHIPLRSDHHRRRPAFQQRGRQQKPFRCGKRESAHKGQQPVNLGLRLAGKVGGLDAVHDASPDLLGVPNLLEEAGVLVDTLDAKGLVLGADSVNEVVVRDFGARNLALDLRVVCDARR